MSVMTAQYSNAPPLASPPLFGHYYNGGVQFNPNQPSTNASSPSSSISPPSPSAQYMPGPVGSNPQLRQAKAPLYIPAVLRPTQNPIRNSPPKDGSRPSFESHDGVRAPAERLGTSGSFESGISRVITEEWSDDALGKVTGPPTRDHWKPDPSSPKCTSPSCATSFSLIARRHHCRRCGNIFCHSHSSGAVPLDQHARFHPDGTVQRACDACYADYEQWLLMRSSRSNSAASSQDTETSSPRMAGVPVGIKIHAGQGAQGGWGQKIGSLAQSVPRDWSWSTF
ncbi:FYVE-domain-containing protein [Rhizodiscina lignyota]|uniref:FYVE-domain-containing protein n=1 Tax=Rhizodiscina lignyota TaxID=1504668 RepID=A0A9P4INY7_9PEZI|nr:FYVE-domain-containing protein [Rhizodiscina lignyota]